MYQRLRHRTTRMSASLHPMWRPYLLNNKWPKLDNFNTLLRVQNILQEAYAFILWDIEYHASKDEMIHISTYLTIYCSNTPGSTQKTRIQNEEALRAYTTAVSHHPQPLNYTWNNVVHCTRIGTIISVNEAVTGKQVGTCI